MIKAIIFDCFGVLVGRGFRETYRLAGGDPVQDHDFIEDMLGLAGLGRISHEEFQAQIAQKIGTSTKQFEQAVAEAEQVDMQLIDYIRELHVTYKTAILSNANIGSLERRFEHNVLHEDFDALVVSGEVRLVKPDPAIYERAAEELGVQPNECVFIDDQQRYCDGAIAVGMQAIRYESVPKLQSELSLLLASVA